MVISHNKTEEIVVTKEHQVATLAGGCFWCIETAFNTVNGIESAVSGYMGGQTLSPSYEQVCSGATGHAEVVQLNFNPVQISYRQILEIFFALHNPTELNRQGNDIGSQYRSGIFYHNAEQKMAAQQIITEMQDQQLWPNAIVTELVAASVFYPAEPYHQAYFNNNPANQYCQLVVSPKLAKFKKTFATHLK
jgi:peptide-methionine (S)-S-oxide reductase